MGIVLLVLSCTITLALFVAGLLGGRMRPLLLLALALAVMLWTLASFAAPADDPDWTKAGYAFVFGLLAIVVLLIWIIAVVVGLLVRRAVFKDAPRSNGYRTG